MNSKVFLLLFFVLIIISPIMAQWNPPPPPEIEPPLPIDGGLTALLVAGGAMGYRAMKKKHEEA